MASFGRILWKWTAGVFAVLAIALAILFGVFRIAVSHVPEYRQPVEAQASKIVGLPVTIGRLDARLGLKGPEVLVEDVAVMTEDGKTPLLEAERAVVGLDVTELLLRWRVSWDSLVLDGVLLDVVREADGAFLALGYRLDEFPRPNPERTIPSGEFRLQNSRLSFEDRASAGPDGGPVTWLLDDIHLNLTNRREGLRISGDFLPPPEAGERVLFWANRLKSDDGWRAYAATQGVEFAALSRIRELEGRVPAAGRVSVRAWSDGEGTRPNKASIEFDLQDVVLPGPRQPGAPAVEAAPAVDYDRLAGRLEWEREAHGWQASLTNFDLSRAASSWRTAAARASTRLEPSTGRRHIEAAADYLRLDDLQPLATLVPDETLRGHLTTMAPRGEVRDLDLEAVINGPDTRGEPQVTLQADLAEVSVRPSGPVPGVKGLSGSVRSDARGGRFEFDGGNVEVEFPRLFRQPLALERAEGLLLWTLGADGLMLIGDGLVLANADLALDAGFRLRLADESQPGSIDLRGEITGLDVTRAGPYLPVGIMKPTLVDWLDAALVAGQVPRAEVHIEGPLRGFPYREDQGTFRVGFTAHQFDLAYAPGWPEAQGLTADVVFENEGLSVGIREGTVSGLDIDQAQVGFEDLLDGRLTIVGDLSGPLPGVLEFLLDSPPIHGALGAALDDVEVTDGTARVSTDLLLPIKDLPSRRVQVDADIDGGVVRYKNLVYPFTDMAGTVRVRDADVFSDNLHAELLGQPIRIDVAPYEDLGVRADLRTHTTAEALIEGLGLPLQNYVAGKTDIHGILQFPEPGSGNKFWMRYESDLEGLAVTLPRPLAKPAAEKTTYVHELRFPNPGEQTWYMQLGGEMSARVELDVSSGRMVFRRATVTGGSLDARLHSGEGLYVDGHFAKVDVDEWLALDFSDPGGPKDGQPAADKEPFRLEKLLAGVDATIDDLEIISQHITNVAVRMAPAQGAWKIDVDSESVAGEVTVPFEMAGRTQPIVLDMQRLSMFDETADGAGADAGEGSGQAGIDPAVVPPLAVSADEFRAYGIRLGQLEGRLEPLPHGFDVPSFSTKGPTFAISGSVRSELGPAVDRSTLQLQVRSTDLAAALEYAGFAPAVAAKDVEFDVDLAWQGGLVPSLLAVATGTARLRLGDGRLTEVKPGAGRVFGLLSVQALPRRLMLDFRDVFEKGFFFDKITGDFSIANGEAYTDNLAMEGRAADIGIIGGVDLVNRAYDQTAVVSAQIGNTLPVVGAIAAGPIIGGGLFVLKEILKEPLREAGQVQYRITGPWEDPAVAKVTEQNRAGTQVSSSKGEPDAGGG